MTVHGSAVLLRIAPGGRLMHHHGHDLDTRIHNNELIAMCKCGKWRVVLPASPDVDLVSLVVQALRQHEKHRDGLDSPAQTEPP
jgi:hypothetical protein